MANLSSSPDLHSFPFLHSTAQQGTAATTADLSNFYTPSGHGAPKATSAGAGSGRRPVDHGGLVARYGTTFGQPPKRAANGNGTGAALALCRCTRSTRGPRHRQQRRATRQLAKYPRNDQGSPAEEYDLGLRAKAGEFRRFCERKQYQDGETVREDKLLLFLVEEVVHRPLRSRSRKAAEDTPLSETRLSWRLVRSYITAITDLYRAQKALGMNTYPSPREDNAREYIKSLQRRDAEQQKANYADKGRDTLLDGYSEEDLKRIAGELWGHTARSAECYIRTLVDLLLGHYVLTRGGNRRALEISDLFTFEFAGEGPT